jgi:hypothetical protein
MRSLGACYCWAWMLVENGVADRCENEHVSDQPGAVAGGSYKQTRAMAKPRTMIAMMHRKT